MNKLRIILIAILLLLLAVIHVMLEKGVVDTSETNKNISNGGGYNLYISKGENPEKVYLRDLSNEIRYEWTLPETSKNQGIIM